MTDSDAGIYGKPHNTEGLWGRLQDIREFSFSVEIPRLPGFGEREFATRVAEKAYDESLKTIQAAKFFQEDSLEVKIDDDKDIIVEYSDDKYHFRLICTPQRIIIRRDGSSIKTFHEWYVKFMPQAPNIIKSILALLGKETARSIVPLRISYRFEFIMYDFRDRSSDQRLRNFEVIKDLVTQTPSDDGKVTGEMAPGLLSRVDYKVHRWTGDKGKRRNLLFDVQAPANKDYTSLWANFGYAGVTYIDAETGERESFQPDALLLEHEKAYLFLKDVAVNGFLGSILGGYNFRTTSSTIP